MGYTHYWRRGIELPPATFAKASSDCRKLLKSVPIEIAGVGGEGTPVANAETIAFNGVGQVAVEGFQVHQTEFDRRGLALVRSSCKTQRAPYDLAVCCALIILKHHFKDAIYIASDGTDADWAAARCACQATLGYGGDFRLDRD